MNKNKHLIVIPFNGFYESISDTQLEDAIRDTFRTDACEDYPEIPDLPSSYYKAIRIAYAKEYVSAFNHAFKTEFDLDLDLEFESLQSPTEYNFTTDRIFCFISETKLSDLLLMAIKYSKLAEVVKETFTSRDGFASFYPADIDEWPRSVKDWDHNQLGVLLEALVTDNEVFETWTLMESSISNGVLANIVWDNLPEEMKQEMSR